MPIINSHIHHIKPVQPVIAAPDGNATPPGHGRCINRALGLRRCQQGAAACSQKRNGATGGARDDPAARGEWRCIDLAAQRSSPRAGSVRMQCIHTAIVTAKAEALPLEEACRREDRRWGLEYPDDSTIRREIGKCAINRSKCYKATACHARGRKNRGATPVLPHAAPRPAGGAQGVHCARQRCHHNPLV